MSIPTKLCGKLFHMTWEINLLVSRREYDAVPQEALSGAVKSDSFLLYSSNNRKNMQ